MTFDSRSKTENRGSGGHDEEHDMRWIPMELYTYGLQVVQGLPACHQRYGGEGPDLPHPSAEAGTPPMASDPNEDGGERTIIIIKPMDVHCRTYASCVGFQASRSRAASIQRLPATRLMLSAVGLDGIVLKLLSNNFLFLITSVNVHYFVFTVEFYLRPNGRINLRLNNFTFYKHLKARSNAHRWSCTAYGSKWKCKAHLIITDKLEVLKANVSHSHPPSTKKEIRNQIKPIYPMWNGTGNKENGTPVRPSQPPSLTPLHDYLVAHSVFSNYV
ncbi:uncharacterized protein LOC128198450 [Bicyclus anynana]|uniref:Uncharacterized protein LOC128198450 n=1 Tax=Bicyclus anynana TaxID=110368 RepID=A0ABM3LLL9_BICAN|nr:uncharacterized protein LOC128198450 [Bicyclus anynana]